jgi:DNA ligase (NAD+)
MNKVVKIKILKDPSKDPSSRKKKVVKVVKKQDDSDDEIIQKVPKDTPSKKSGLRDHDKIQDDPEGYANQVTIERLVTILQKMSDYYYAESRPLVEDNIYDVMLDVLKERDPDNSYLFQTGVEKTTDKDIDLPYYMPSLDKIKPGEKSLPRWFKSYKGPYIVMDKLDGISVQIHKDNEGNVDLFTKKRTGTGTSKKYMLKYLADKKTLDKMPNGTSVRGEVVISRKDFEAVQEFEPDLKNPRTAMAGLMNTDKLDTRIAKKAQFVTYNILYPRYTLTDQHRKLKSWGFKVVWNKKYESADLEDVEEADEADDEAEDQKTKQIESNLKIILGERVTKSEFLADGIVLYDDSEIYEHDDGNPKHAMAFKMNSTTDMKDAVVEEVMWDPSMYGDLRPVVRIKPVVLSGNTTVTYCTAHNAKFVKDNMIGKGAIIKIVRSGDVIPYIVEVVKPAKKPQMPDMEYEWNESGVQIVVVNPSEEIERKMQIKQNLHFFRKLGVKFLSEGLTAKFYDAGYQTIVSIVKCADDRDTDPYKIGGLGEKMVTKIYDQIDKAFTRVNLPEIMSGSLKFGAGLGVRKIKEIVKKYPNILEMKDDDPEDLKDQIMDVDGFSNILATKFTENLVVFCEFLDELRENCSYDLSFKPKIQLKVKGKTKGKNKDQEVDNGVDMSKEKVVMTGFRSDRITDFVENNGGKIANSVSKNTTMVIYVASDKGSSKIDKARELGITLITREEFEKKYGIK